MLKLIIVSNEGELLRVQCEGEIKRIEFAVDKNPLDGLAIPDLYRRKMLFDLERVALLDSSGIGWLVASNKSFETAGGRMVLHSIPPMIRDMLQFTHMHRVLRLANDETAAMDLANGGKP